MATIKEIRTFKDIQDAILSRARLQDTVANRLDLQERINTKYQEIGLLENYRWSGETRSLVVPAYYSTGTVAVTQGETTVTGTSTVWVENTHLFRTIQIGSDAFPYKIIRVDEAGQTLEVDPPYQGTTIASGGAYKIFKNEFGLWPDCKNVRSISVPGGPKRTLPIGPKEMDEINKRTPFSTGVVRRYTTEGFAYYSEKTWATFLIDTDFWEDNPVTTQPRNKKLIIWPALDTVARNISIRVSVDLPPMLLDADEPKIPYPYRPVLVWGVLKERFAENRDIQTKREWEIEYEKYIKKMASEIEETDDELLLVVNRSTNRRRHSAFFDDEFDEALLRS